ncbi:hypothetical protein [Micromonospora sp. NPDC049274]|uniref:hypothetical protein n=1 Tax=Micromonospora sp. NPDC049274 TaxID=3154829 RepID=UPI0034129981
MTELETLLSLSESASWSDRGKAGSGLVAHVGEPTVDAAILRLLLDERDTAVTVATANALLARADLASWRMFVRGWAVATQRSSMTNYVDHLYSCLNSAMYVASLDSGKTARLKGLAERFTSDDHDETLKTAAREIRDLVFESL